MNDRNDRMIEINDTLLDLWMIKINGRLFGRKMMKTYGVLLYSVIQ